MAVEELGSVAHRIALIGDVTTEVGRNEQFKMLEAAEGLERLARRQSLEIALAQLSASGEAEAAQGTLTRQLALTQQLDDIRATNIKAWADVGLRERIPVWHIEPRWRLLLNVFVASIDFYVFARAFAIGSDITTDLTNPLFLMGGAVGLMVFFVGLLWARVFKERVVFSAQRQLQEEGVAVSASGERLLPGGSSRFVMLALTLIYFALTLGGLAVRWGGMRGPTDLPATVMLTLIPLVTVALEIVVHDPFEVPLPHRVRLGLVQRLRTRWRARRERSLLLKLTKVEKAIEQRYSFERAALTALHDAVPTRPAPRKDS